MKRGLVLSGGAAWGLSNIGVLEVFEREDIRFDCIAGSSMGAIVAAAYALGIRVQELKEVAQKLSPLTIARISKKPLAEGLHGGLMHQRLEEILSLVLGNATIADCRIPFVCVAGRVRQPIKWHKIFLPGFADHFEDSVEPYVFPTTTRLMDALLATSAIPVLFSPVTVGKDTFVDLVHFGAIPARELQKLHHPDVLIATDTNPRYATLQRFLPAAWSEFIDRGHDELTKDRDICDVIIEPAMPAGVFRFDQADAFVEAGRKAAEDAMPAIKKAGGH